MKRTLILSIVALAATCSVDLFACCVGPTCIALNKTLVVGGNTWCIHAGALSQTTADGQRTIWQMKLPEWTSGVVRYTDRYNAEHIRDAQHRPLMQSSTMNVVHYTSKNSSLPDGEIERVHVDERGDVWVVNDFGHVGVFNGTEWKLVETPIKWSRDARFSDGKLYLLSGRAIVTVDLESQKVVQVDSSVKGQLFRQFIDASMVISRKNRLEGESLTMEPNLSTTSAPTRTKILQGSSEYKEYVASVKAACEDFHDKKNVCRTYRYDGVFDIATDNNGYVYVAWDEGLTVFKLIEFDDEKFTSEPVDMVAPFPNPATTHMTFGLNGTGHGETVVTLIDQGGTASLIHTSDQSGSVPVDVSQLATGTYLAVIRSEKGTASRLVQIVR